jgi:hypothetical protein
MPSIAENLNSLRKFEFFEKIHQERMFFCMNQDTRQELKLCIAGILEILEILEM